MGILLLYDGLQGYRAGREDSKERAVGGSGAAYGVKGSELWLFIFSLQVPYTVSCFFNDDNGAIGKRIRRLIQHSAQSLNDIRGARVPQPEYHDPRARAISQCGDFSEVQVESQDYTPFIRGFLEDSAIGQALKSFFTQMRNLMSLITQPRYNLHADTHINQEAHTTPQYM
jgi:hypothetical protein